MSLASWLAPPILLALIGIFVNQIVAWKNRAYATGRKDLEEELLAKRVAALEAKPSQDLSSLSDKIKAELHESFDDRVSRIKTDCIEGVAEVKQRLKTIETAREADLQEELDRLRRKVSSARHPAVREDPRAEPISSDPPFGPESPMPPLRPGRRR